MRKKFTMLLVSLFLFGLGTMSAQVTKYYKPGERKTTLAVGDKVMFYNTAFNGDQDRTGFLVDNGTGFDLNKQKPSVSPFFSEKVGVWTIEVAENNTTYYKVNVKGTNGYVGIGGKTNNGTAQDMYIHQWTEIAESKRETVNSEKADGTVIANGEIKETDNLWLVANGAEANAINNTWNGNANSFATWSTGHPYAIYSIVEATPTELEELLATAKTTAKTTLDELAMLSLYNVGTAAKDVDGVTMTNNDLETALNTIDEIVLNVKKSIDGKNVKFRNQSTEDGRGGNFLGYDKAYSRPAAVADGGDAAIWTIKTNADGTFKLYNFVNDFYLGTPADPTPVVKAEADAPSFKFIVTAEDEVALATGDKMVHIANHSNYKVINHWSTTDKASLWAVTAVPAIVVDHETLNAANTAAATLLHSIQQAYGTTDATKYTSNAKESSEGSYEGLIDGVYNDPSYFHSTYNSNPGEYHYLQVEVTEGIKDFYFYFKKRQGNDANRPTQIEILGSTDGGEFTSIKTINSGLPTDAGVIEYISDVVNASTNVKYVRFVVKATNTDAKDTGGEHPFFTFSEFYVLPATADVNDLLTAYNNFASSSITSESFATAAAALINAETTLALSNIKKEVAALLAANASNHAETPVLGQYTTEAYNALNAAYTANDATQASLETAIAGFKAAKNLPVFTIDGVISYAAGKSIYDDGVDAPNFKLTNLCNKTMWWALDMTETTVGVIEEVGIYNVGTGNGFWGASSIKITETSEDNGAGIANDGIFLFYTKGNNTPIHYQNTNQVIVRFGDKSATSGSAHKFTYIGNTYDLNKLGEEPTMPVATIINNSTNTFFSTLQAAFNAATEGQTVKLIAHNTSEKITIGKTVTLDLNNKTITRNGEGYAFEVTDGELILEGNGDINGGVHYIINDADYKTNTYSMSADKENVDITYNRNFGHTNWQVLYVPFAIPVENMSDFKVYTITSTNSDAVVVDQVTEGTLAAHTPYLIKASETGNKAITVEDATLEAAPADGYNATFGDYTFTGTYAPTTITAETEYVLTGGEWHRLDNSSQVLGAFRVYLTVANNDAPVLRIITRGEEDTTAIDSAVLNAQPSSVIYDLLGRRVEKMDKGIYIVNGRKVVVK